MRLLYVTTKISGAGGMQRVLAVKSDFLIVNKGYEIHILITNAEDDESVLYDFNPQIVFHNINPHRSALHYFWSYKKLLNECVEAINPDIIIMMDNGLKSFLLPFILKKKYPLIYELHVSKYILKSEGIMAVKDKFIFPFMAFAASRFYAFVVLTHNGSSEWKLNNLHVIPNPLWFTTDQVNNTESKIAVAVGRHVYEKGYDRMFTVWKQVLASYPDWQLHIYGDAHKETDLYGLAKQEGILDNVKFFGAEKDIIKVYQNASVYLMTSRYEGFGMVLLEAMACGLPCVAFDCPVGPSGIIKDNYNGFLIEDGDIQNFTEALKKLIDDKDMHIEMGYNAKVSSAGFALPLVMKQWDTLFESVVK